MKAFLLLVALSLGACQKSAVDPDQTPADFAVAFDKDFALHHQQQALLPTAAKPELTVRLEDIKYTYCPEGHMCFAGSMAWPVLAITDAQGQTQTLQLPDSVLTRPANSAWLDKATIKANGRRYLLTYTVWEVERTLGKGEMPAKKDFALWFTIAPPSNQ